MKALLVCLLLVAAAAAEKARFDGHKVVRMVPRNEQQLVFLRQLQETDFDLDFWMEPSKINRQVDLRLSPAQEASYMPSFNAVGLVPEVFIQDVQVLINEESRNHDANRWSDWSDFEELEEIEAWLGEQAAAYSDFVTLTDIGDTFEGRDVWVLRINRNPSSDKAVLWLDCNIHAREWITSAVCTYMINELLTNPSYESWLDEWDFHILPVLNPDGFKYSHTDFRMWRKTRSDYGLECIGTDPNRNWDSHWSESGASNNPCSDTFYGPSALSEPANRAAADYILENADAITLHLTFHSYSQLILVPWGWTYEEPEDFDDLMGVGLAGEAAIEGAGLGDGIWETDTPPNLLYIVSGDHSDWAKEKAGIKYSYTFELRDRGNYGFILPPDQIIPAAEETLAGVFAMMEARLSAPN